MRPGWPRARHLLGERGAAIVDFVFVLVLLIPLFLGILQLALVLHVRNVLTAAASEGARYAATFDRNEGDGVARTRSQIQGALGASYAQDVKPEPTTVGGAPAVRIVVRAQVPALGLGGPSVDLTVSGTAVEENPP